MRDAAPADGAGISGGCMRALDADGRLRLPAAWKTARRITLPPSTWTPPC